jgi:hypothetical protein
MALYMLISVWVNSVIGKIFTFHGVIHVNFCVGKFCLKIKKQEHLGSKNMRTLNFHYDNR